MFEVLAREELYSILKGQDVCRNPGHPGAVVS